MYAGKGRSTETGDKSPCKFAQQGQTLIPSWVEFIHEQVHKVKVSALTNLIAISALFCGMVSFPTALTQRIGGAVLSQMSFLAASMAHLPRHLSL
jgi:hypothetical protein